MQGNKYRPFFPMMLCENFTDENKGTTGRAGNARRPCSKSRSAPSIIEIYGEGTSNMAASRSPQSLYFPVWGTLEEKWRSSSREYFIIIYLYNYSLKVQKANVP